MPDSLIDAFRTVLKEKHKPWVLFDNGTCVVIEDPGDDIERQAVALLERYGPVHVGTDTADFDVVRPQGCPGWLVTCYHPDILVYVSPQEAPPGAEDLIVGLLGRAKRKRDAESLSVAHVERAS